MKKYAFLAIACLVSIAGIGGFISPTLASEQLSISYRHNSPSNVVHASRTYYDTVTITVQGTGQAAGRQQSDAFYLYTDENGANSTPRPAREFGLYINGRPAGNYATPSYRSDHSYQFTIPASSSGTRFHFSIGDTYVSDNTGALRVTISGDDSYQGDDGYYDDYYYERRTIDLQPTEIRFNQGGSSFAQGEAITPRVRVTNNGSRRSSSFTVYWYVDGVREQSTTHDGLNPHESEWVYVSRLWRTNDARHTFEVRVDPQDRIDESNEGNNTKTAYVYRTNYRTSYTNDYDWYQPPVQQTGVWYTAPHNRERMLVDERTVHAVIRSLGVGISNADLAAIPIGVLENDPARDSDADGLSDALEGALGTLPDDWDTDNDGYGDGQEVRDGYNPNGPGMYYRPNQKLVERLKGYILLQVERRGEAWYVNPADGKRYYLGGSNEAYHVFHQFLRN